MTAGAYLDPIPGVIPFGTITIFAGASGAGKTTMIAEWVHRWRNNKPIWGHPTNPPTAFAVIAADRQWATNHKWFVRAGVGDIPHYSLADDPNFDHKELLQALNALDLFKRALDVCFNGTPPPPGAHVIVDPITPLLIAGNPNSSRDVARTLLGMSRIIQDRQLTLTALAHFGKQPGDEKARYQRPQDRIAGSGAFAGFSDTQMYICDPEPPDHPYHMFGWTPRLARPEEFPCTRDEKTGLFMPYDVIQEDLVAGQILECLEPMGPTPIAVVRERAYDQYQYSPGTVKRALGRLLEQGRVAKVKYGVYARVKLH